MSEHGPPRDVHDTGVRTLLVHTAQSPRPTSELLYLPSAQSIQGDPVNPFVEVPSRHAVQSAEDVEPGIDENPAAQSAHVADPRADAYLPAAQNSHRNCPDCPSVLVPAGHLSHAAPPKIAYLPATQFVHSPFEERTVPAEQMQALYPGSDAI